VESLNGKGAVVTGGASGIGLETARRLAARGAHVVLADIERGALDRAVEELRSNGASAWGVECDVSSLAAVTALTDEAFRLLDRVHIVFNNAGVALGGPIASMSHDDWRWIIDVDLWGPIHGVEVFVPRLIDQGEGGHVLFTASFAGLVPNVGLGPYCVAKYGVVALAEVLARELRPHSIGVSVLCPMRVGTNIGNSERNRATDYGVADVASTLADSAAQDDALAGRIIPVEDAAEATVQAILDNRLYIVTHDESRESIRRRFERIDRSFEGG